MDANVIERRGFSVVYAGLWRVVGWAAAPAFAVGGLMSAASATTPSLFNAPYDRIVIDCSGVAPAYADSLCAAVATELRAQSSKPVVSSVSAGASDIVVNVGTRRPRGAEGNAVELAMWLSRPVGRNGDPAVRPVKTALLQFNEKGQVANPQAAVRDALRAVFSTRRFARAPSPPRAQ